VQEGGEVGLILERNARTGLFEIEGYTIPEGKTMTKKERLKAYLAESINEPSVELKD